MNFYLLFFLFDECLQDAAINAVYLSGSV